MLRILRARKNLRKLLRECWRDGKCDPDEAYALYTSRLKDGYGIDPSTIVWLAKLAWELFKLWQQWRVEDASEATIPDELFTDELPEELSE